MVNLDTEDGKDEIDHKKARSKDKKKREKPRDDKYVHQWIKNSNKEQKNGVPIEDFVIEKINDYKINTSRRHWYDRAGEPLYRVCWYSYESFDYTWEPAQHLPSGKILSYYRKKKFPIPESLLLTKPTAAELYKLH